MGDEMSLVHLLINTWIGISNHWNERGVQGWVRDEIGPPMDQY